jgi:hypothetical protein
MLRNPNSSTARSGFALTALALAVLAAAAPAPLLAAGPQFSATFTVANAQPSGDSVNLTFSFELRVAQPTDLVVEAVKLGNPSAADLAYATFTGGTIPVGGVLKGSDSVTVPKSVFKKWKSGQPAALFVRTAGDTGSAMWARVDASAAGSIK